VQINFRVNTLSVVIDNLLNFPNPFVDFTTFSFEHNQAGKNLEVSIDIISLTGTYMHNITQNLSFDGYRAVNITWDGRIEGGGQLNTGMYIYRVTLTNEQGETASKSGKLIYEKR
jgi:flagellar hook assembly protein FlgD